MKRRCLHDESGAALIVAVALALVLAGMALTMVSLTITEKGITYSQEIGTRALYSADAGVEIAKQQMAAFSQAKMESLRNVWPGVGAIISEPMRFFPAGGLAYQNDELGTDVVTTFEFMDSTLHSTSQTFDFRYTTLARGTAASTGRSSIISEGNLRLSASRGTFSDYLIFTDVHYTPDGKEIWFHTSGYFDGRIHSNGQLRFAYFPTFEDLVTCVPQRAAYYNGGHPVELDADRNGDRDVPNFYGGFERGVDPVYLPENSFSQERAALGYAATDTTPLADSQIKEALGFDPLDPSPIPKGIYVPNDGVFVTGGIYVVGNASDVRLSVDADGCQNYELTDEMGLTKRIVLDEANGRTKIYSAGGSTIYSGMPRGMLYVTGGVANLGGPPRSGGTPPPAIEAGTQLTITATKDILIDRDIVYEDYINCESILGIYSSGGDVRIVKAAPDDLMLDCFVMAAGSKGAFRVDDYNKGSYRGQVHVRGGVVERYYGAFGTFSGSGASTGYGRDFGYDGRGISPPYYPLTRVFKVDSPVPHPTSWMET